MFTPNCYFYGDENVSPFYKLIFKEEKSKESGGKEGRQVGWREGEREGKIDKVSTGF